MTAKVKLCPSEHQAVWLKQTLHAFREASNHLSMIVHNEKIRSQIALHKFMYRELRKTFSLRSQMAQSVIRTVIAKYKSFMSNGHPWTRVHFKKPEYDLVWNRDYSMAKNQMFSINTLHGRIKVPFIVKGMVPYFDGTWAFGTAKLVHKKGKFFLHIPVSKEVEKTETAAIDQVVGIDLGINFVATSYDSQGKCTFYPGRPIKDKRSNYKRLRKQLQQVGTASARKKLKRMAGRENRWMQDVNHCVSKALVRKYGGNTLFVVEDLTGIRGVTEQVRIKDRYEMVSWSFSQLRKMIEYKAIAHGSKVIAVDPRFTSQTCPKCGRFEKANRDKKNHRFRCKECGYQSNDDRIAAMNLQWIGMKYIAEGVA